MNKKNKILDRILFLGGPPRSGTTILSRVLNRHTQIMAIIDDHVFESWTLYNYRDHSGLVSQILDGTVSSRQAKTLIWKRIKQDRWITGAAASEKPRGCPPAPPARRHCGPLLPVERGTIRYKYPLNQIKNIRYLSLKSPEISLVLADMASLFPHAKFILSYRSPETVAVSMFRKAMEVTQVPVFWKRWEQNLDKNGKLIPPAAVPPRWEKVWQTATPFQKCLLCAYGYMFHLKEGMKQIPSARFFLFHHAELVGNPDQVLHAWADFLGLEADGFPDINSMLHDSRHSLKKELAKEKSDLESKIRPEQIWTEVKRLDSMKKSRQ